MQPVFWQAIFFKVAFPDSVLQHRVIVATMNPFLSALVALSPDSAKLATRTSGYSALASIILAMENFRNLGETSLIYSPVNLTRARS